MSPEPFDSRAKAPPAKRWEKGYGDENVQNIVRFGAWDKESEKLETSLVLSVTLGGRLTVKT